MPDSTKNIPDTKLKSAIPVQAGLFKYPLMNGERPALKGNRCNHCGKNLFPKAGHLP